MQENNTPQTKLNKKDLLKNVAKELFYKQGYNDTTFVQLSNISGVNNGLITYYFKTKANLASQIFTVFIFDLRDELAKQLRNLCGDFELALSIAVETRIVFRLNISNKNLSKFISEYSKVQYSTDYNEIKAQYYGMQKHLINPNISDEDMRLYEVCRRAINQALANAYSDKYTSASIEHLEEYSLKLLFFMLGLSKERTQQLIDESAELANKINITVEDAFNVIGK